MSKRLYISIFFALFLHLALITSINYNKSYPNLKADLFNNKITINFSNLSERIVKNINKNNIKKNIAEDVVKVSNAVQYTSKDSLDQDSSNIIPTIDDFQLVGKKNLPQYPKRALKLHQEGVVYLRILVSHQGRPEEIVFTQKSKYDLLNQAAFDAVSSWEFKTIDVNGYKSKMWVNVPIEFKIS